ncbi:hypothetical protein DEH18_29020 [Streptomyces sp. NHF165]|nr:hypothetical protein DEH18_29020 [Streptomyces sp. NHF165]
MEAGYPASQETPRSTRGFLGSERHSVCCAGWAFGFVRNRPQDPLVRTDALDGADELVGGRRDI